MRSGTFAKRQEQRLRHALKPDIPRPPSKQIPTVAGSGTAVTVKLSTRSVPTVVTVAPLALVVDASTSRKYTLPSLFKAVMLLRLSAKEVVKTVLLVAQKFGATFTRTEYEAKLVKLVPSVLY